MRGRRLLKSFALVCCAAVGAALLVFAGAAARVYAYADNSSDAQADAAIVLGAAVWSDRPSPVFRERINHAVNLYRRGRVRKLILTGGRGAANEPAESAAARAYAVKLGVKPEDILAESRSRTTYENLQHAGRLASQRGLKRLLVVTDPLHMRRAVSMARDLGLDAHPAPTPTTRYRTLGSQSSLLLQETFNYLAYLVGRTSSSD